MIQLFRNILLALNLKWAYIFKKNKTINCLSFNSWYVLFVFCHFLIISTLNIICKVLNLTFYLWTNICWLFDNNIEIILKIFLSFFLFWPNTKILMAWVTHTLVTLLWVMHYVQLTGSRHACHGGWAELHHSYGRRRRLKRRHCHQWNLHNRHTYIHNKKGKRRKIYWRMKGVIDRKSWLHTSVIATFQQCRRNAKLYCNSFTQTAFGSGLGHIWWHHICSMKANAF